MNKESMMLTISLSVISQWVDSFLSFALMIDQSALVAHGGFTATGVNDL